MGRSRASRGSGTTRVRYGRLVAAGSALLVTLVAMLGAVGVLPANAPMASATGGAGARATVTSLILPDSSRSAPETTRAMPPRVEDDVALPARSGTGKRIVFDIAQQRVWLVGHGRGGDHVRRTYLVSGSLTDNLAPGTYEVFSRSRWATGIDDSGTMEYFVRFTRGQHAAIGFHSIPTKDGRPLQTRDQLGTPRSHGCIRQARPDAKKLWAFAPVGTTVVVTA